MKIALIVILAMVFLICCNRSEKNKNEQDIQECYDFADQHWLEDTYREWWEQLPDSVKDKYSHTLPDEHNRQYYELIGEYDQFAFAWEDFDPNTAGADSMTPHREWYLECLDRAREKKKLLPTTPE